jgi:hypothetical protein
VPDRLLRAYGFQHRQPIRARSSAHVDDAVDTYQHAHQVDSHLDADHFAHDHADARPHQDSHAHVDAIGHANLSADADLPPDGYRDPSGYAFSVALYLRRELWATAVRVQLDGRGRPRTGPGR